MRFVSFFLSFLCVCSLLVVVAFGMCTFFFRLVSAFHWANLDIWNVRCALTELYVLYRFFSFIFQHKNICFIQSWALALSLSIFILVASRQLHRFIDIFPRSHMCSSSSNTLTYILYADSLSCTRTGMCFKTSHQFVWQNIQLKGLLNWETDDILKWNDIELGCVSRLHAIIWIEGLWRWNGTFFGGFSSVNSNEFQLCSWTCLAPSKHLSRITIDYILDGIEINAQAMSMQFTLRITCNKC